jgi:hypothetical protein
MQDEILHKIDFVSNTEQSGKEKPKRVFDFVLSLHTQQAKNSCEISSYSYVV